MTSTAPQRRFIGGPSIGDFRIFNAEFTVALDSGRLTVFQTDFGAQPVRVLHMPDPEAARPDEHWCYYTDSAQETRRTIRRNAMRLYRSATHSHRN
ncbi:hypothetical protein [Salininema proteolyticum]|uniref:Uncharacterized protein n=1 Tax=Salininema proteolyticum TaxID=1607685 RepID=A0ABV8U2U0_9ACTN